MKHAEQQCTAGVCEGSFFLLLVQCRPHTTVSFIKGFPGVYGHPGTGVVERWEGLIAGVATHAGPGHARPEPVQVQPMVAVQGVAWSNLSAVPVTAGGVDACVCR